MNKFLWKEGQDAKSMISVSQIQTFMSCKKKWMYNYIEGLTPRIERPYLSIGRLCHKGMQVAMHEMWKQEGWNVALLRGCEAMEQMWIDYLGENTFLEEEIPDLEQTFEDALAVFKQAFVEFEPWKYKVLSIEGQPALELHFVVPCEGSNGLHGFIDAILEDTETGFIWCTDYKFRKSLAPDDDETFNLQNAVYAYACEKLGIDITGTMTWQHLNTPASEPKLNKDGTVSRAKIKTTWTKYREFCEEHGIDWTDYEEEMTEKLKDIEFFRATYEYRNSETINNIFEQCIVPASFGIWNARNGSYTCKGESALYKSLYPWNCKMCQYKSLCQAELRNYDTDAIIAREYTLHSFIKKEEENNED